MPDTLQIAGVVALLGGLVFVAWLLGGRKPILPLRMPLGQNRQRRMTVVERLPLIAQNVLHLVEVDGERLLILTSGASAQIVQRAPDRTNPPDGACS